MNVNKVKTKVSFNLSPISSVISENGNDQGINMNKNS